MKKVLKYFLPLILLLISCETEVEYFVTTNYHYKNSTSSDINLMLYDIDNQLIDTIIIGSQEIHIDNLEAEGFKNGIVPPFSYSYGKTMKVIIKFQNTNTCITFNNNQGILNYINYDNYNSSMQNNNVNDLYFDIGSEEKNMAINCN